MAGLQRRTAILRTLSPGDAQGQPGLLAIPPIALIANLVTVANQGYFSRFVPEEDMFVTKISFICTVLDVADPAVDVGIYDASTATPTRLASKGSTTGLLTATGVKTVTLPTPVLLTAGNVYAAAFTSASAAVATIQAHNVNAAAILGLFGGSFPASYAMIAAAMLPLPAGPVTVNSATNTNVLLAVRTD